jgi:hypothetical protein
MSDADSDSNGEANEYSGVLKETEEELEERQRAKWTDTEESEGKFYRAVDDSEVQQIKNKETAGPCQKRWFPYCEEEATFFFDASIDPQQARQDASNLARRNDRRVLCWSPECPVEVEPDRSAEHHPDDGWNTSVAHEGSADLTNDDFALCDPGDLKDCPS